MLTNGVEVVCIRPTHINAIQGSWTYCFAQYDTVPTGVPPHQQTQCRQRRW
eukprot:m.1116927 g.1116927  ORF g.1116927 m.1116927 type:complete len:51 (-) comp24380_c0_seq5:4220-4372(-)